MGCDIHAMIERKENKDFHWWVNCGNPEIDRDYTIFSILANVRNYDEIPFISEPRGKPQECSTEFEAFLEWWSGDAHSVSWITLEEIKSYDTNQKFYDHSLILGKDEEGNIISTCRGTNGEHMGEVGETTIFGVWGNNQWKSLIEKMEKAKVNNDDNIRLVFFFDN